MYQQSSYERQSNLPHETVTESNEEVKNNYNVGQYPTIIISFLNLKSYGNIARRTSNTYGKSGKNISSSAFSKANYFFDSEIWHQLFYNPSIF